MSTSSVRRLKERGGGGGKVTAAVIEPAAAKPYKTLTPVSGKFTGAEILLKRSTGKENPRPTSRVRAAALSQKPAAIRPMPRIDKPSACSGDNSETRVRKSTSSVPRGRSSSPSEFNRVLSDLSKLRVSRVPCEKVPSSEYKRSVSTNGKFMNGFRGLEKIQPKKGAFRDSNVKNTEICEDVNLKSEKRETFSGRVVDGCNGDVNLRPVTKSSLESCTFVSNLESSVKVLDGKRVFGESKGRSCYEMSSDGVVENSVNCVDSGSKELRRKTLNKLRALEKLKEKVENGEVVGARSINSCTLQSNLDSSVKVLDGKRVLGESKGRSCSGTSSDGVVEKNVDCLDSGSKELKRKTLNSLRGSENLKEKAVNGEVVGARRNNSCTYESNLESSVKVLDGKRVLGESKGRSCSETSSDGVVEKSVNSIDSGSKELKRKTLNSLRASENLKEKAVNGEVVGARSINKYTSEIHARIAVLEGRVNKITSDIKRTKEMLDRDDPHVSKEEISDIRERVSGMEKAVGNVVSDAEFNVVATKTIQNDDGQIKISEGCIKKQDDQLKGSVKGLKSEELEARFFPHHKLLRDRTSLKPLLGSSQSHQTDFVVSTNESKPEEKLLSPDENPIALEFLASLNTESKVTIRDGQDGSELGEIQEMDVAATSGKENSSNLLNGKHDIELILTTDETVDEFDDQENKPTMIIEEELEDSCIYLLNEIGHKTSTGGWFVSEGESVLLAHNDGSCSFYDIANSEEKAEYKPPVEVSPNIWRDCWIIRAPGADGCSGRYVVAASAGNTTDTGFCSWDFYTKDVRAFHIEDLNTSSRTALAPISNTTVHRRNVLSSIRAQENQQWWYKPCGPLIVSTASSQKVVRIYDIRDGEQIMNWEVQKPVLAMDYSSPLQWRNRGKVVVAEAETISLWDVSSLSSQSLMSVSSLGRKISALHVNNTDAELGGGVRQRVSSSEAEGNDGLFCTPDSINVLDFRHPSGVGAKIPKLGVTAHSVFSRSDSIFLGCTNTRSVGKKQPISQVQQFSLRKQRLVSTYSLPESNAHSHYTDITQVWGNSNFVMGVCGLGLFVFDAFKDDVLQPLGIGYGDTQEVREVIGPDDLYSPSFDYLGSRVLLISRDRPALWRYLL